MMGSKYGAVRTTVDGITFASKAEARRYAELKMLQKAGEISSLELQPTYSLRVPMCGGGYAEIGRYLADFKYREGPKGLLRVEDVKGVKTALYKWKKKHVEAQYGITVMEIK